MARESDDVNRVDVTGTNYISSLDNFPELWTEILQRVPESDRLRHVPFVSRRFNEACRDPSLWPELRVLYSAFRTEARWRSFLRWLAVRAPGLRMLVFGRNTSAHVLDAAAWERRTSELVALLAASAPGLRSLEFWYPFRVPVSAASALPAELGRLSQLTSLILDFGMAPVTTAQLDAMVQTLPSLQRLSLSVRAITDGFPVSVTSCCSQLRHLEIGGGQLGALPPEMGRLEALTRLGLKGSSFTSLPDSISRLTTLRELDLGGSPDPILPCGLTACQKLTLLKMKMCRANPPVLGRLQSLRNLVLTSLLPQPHDSYWTQLTALTELQLFLDRRSSVPAGLAGMTSLRKLTIHDAQLGDLPSGPYLGCLDRLVLKDCFSLTRVPPALAAATQLRHLSLSYGGRNQIQLTASDMAVLRALPALTTLSFTKPRDVGQRVWDECEVQLQAACIAQRSAPPAVINQL